MTQELIYFARLTLLDKITTICYIILTGILAYFFLHVNSDSSNRTLLYFYTLGTQLSLYLLYYGSLRNMSVFIIWILFSFAHLYFYYLLKDNPGLQNVRGHAAAGLKNLTITLFLFQVLRFLSLKIQAKELVAPNRSGQTDIYEGRKITMLDYILFVVYFGITIFLNI